MSALRFLLWMGGTVVGLCCLVIVLTIVVDPYRLYDTPTIAGWTVQKPRLDEHQFASKLGQIERLHPNTLLLGNSRVEVGIDPESAQWRAADQPVYNAALAGQGLGPAADLLRDAFAVHPPRLVVVGLDILDFLERPDAPPLPPTVIGPDERRLLVDRAGKPNPARPLQRLRDYFTATITLDAVIDSLATVFDQDPETATTITPLGFDPQHEYRVFAARQGYYALFQQKNDIYWSQYRHHPAADFVEPFRYASFRQLEEIISLCRVHKTKLILFIHPYHADYLDLLQGVGLWPTFENWKRALVRVAEPEIRNADLLLFDFSGYNIFSTERVPPPGDRHTVMRWYWEAGHYKAALGDEMLARMLHGAGRFGVGLNSANIDAVLIAERDSEQKSKNGQTSSR